MLNITVLQFVKMFRSVLWYALFSGMSYIVHSRRVHGSLIEYMLSIQKALCLLWRTVDSQFTLSWAIAKVEGLYCPNLPYSLGDALYSLHYKLHQCTINLS